MAKQAFSGRTKHWKSNLKLNIIINIKNMFALRSSTKKCAKQLTGALFFNRQTTLAKNSQASLYTENLADVVSSRLPSIVWNADALHGLTREQMDFRQSVRAFAEKELPEEVVKKVVLVC